MSIPEHKRYFWCIMAILLGIASVIPMHANAQALEVKVQDQEGNPIPKAKVQIRSEERPQLTNESGVATFSNVSDAESLTVSANGFLDKRIDINAGETEALVDLTPAALKVVVQEQNGKPIPEAKVKVGNQEKTTDKFGVAMFSDDDVSGAESLTVSANGFSDKRIDIYVGKTEASVVLTSVQTIVQQIVLLAIFVLIQIVVFVSVWRNLSKQVSWHVYTNAWASILTVIGIFGTFLGIFIGLLAFDIGDIEGSIPGLLGGLKLAFLTSLVGILSAIILKWKGLRQTQKRSDPNQAAIKDLAAELGDTLANIRTQGETDLLDQMVTLNTAIREEGRETRAALGNIKDDLTGIHTSLTDGQKDTIAELQGLTTTFSEKHDHLNSTVAEKHDSLINLQTEEGNQTREKLTNLQTAFTNGYSTLSAQLENLTTTVSDKHDLLIDEFQTFSKNVAETHKTLTNMQSEVTGRQNKAFIQLRELTKTVSYEHSQLRKEFENFSNNVAKSITELATKELISSLAKVIDQFNTQLSTQFGDNFKQLNEAVGRTVDWQKQYQQQMDKLAEEFRVAAKSIDDSRDSLKNIADSSSTIADKSGSIVTSATKLEPILHTLNDQLGAFSDLRQKASDAFPIIEGRLDALTTGFSDAVEKAITDSQEQSKKLKTQYDEFQKVINGLEGFTTKIDKVTTDVSNIVKDLEAIIESQTKALENSASYVTTMQSKLDDQLTKSISELGIHLASLSKKFAKDYKPLTESLTKVLTIAEGILPKQPGN